jgi:hypothetical protein
MFCALEDLKTESDVEQKLLWPLLTTPTPSGLELRPADVVTKLNIRRLEIGKGVSRKLYFPDYIVVLAGLPVLVVEAKAPGEPLDAALEEARLYGNEINALFPSGINPCVRVIACNGQQLASAPLDTATPDIALLHTDLSAANAGFVELLERCQRTVLQQHADRVRTRFRKPRYQRPVSMVGGTAFQNEELAPNTFGATIAGDYGHVFNPRTKEDRARVVRHAYIPSLRRQRYVEPIDRLIRAAVTPTMAKIRAFDDTGNPAELTTALRERRHLENQVLLLIGSVGSGKSTFIDYVSLVALSDELKKRSVWVRINLNEAPLAADVAYSWLARAITADLRAQVGDEDIDDIAALSKIFGPELNAFRKGAVSLLDHGSIEYQTRLADELIRLQRDSIVFAQCLARYVCGGPGKLLIVALDNCDKRTRDEQLLMFQIAQWVRTEFRSLVILPLRDVTFERHRHEPPLDTALKGLVFRIEPPPFTDVLQARVRLALEEMQANAATANTLSYVLPNGIRVSYPASDQALYLASILRSLYEHDRFVRRIMTGLAGRDVRRALEIFLDFCTSGHIGEDEIYKIRFHEGRYVLPLSVVARVLLRMQRRFYDGDRAYIKNIVQCHANDALPDHFVRLSLLHWLEQHQRVAGPAGVQGFHQIGNIAHDLAQLGHDGKRVREELLYLVREGCIVAEHQRLDQIADEDLVKLTASGLVHLQLMANPDYLAACAEDTWISDPQLAQRFANRISERGLAGHFSRLTTAKNASDFVEYLRSHATERIGAPEVYLDKRALIELNTLREAEAAVGAAEIEVSKQLYVGNLPFDATPDTVRNALETAGINVVRVAIPPAPLGKANRGFAFVEVADGRAAMEALDSPDLVIGRRRLVINEAYQLKSDVTPRPSRPRAWADVSERLYVGNLPLTSSEESVRALFSSHGFRPVDVYVALNRATRSPLGYAFVSMASEDEATQAIGALNGSLVDGRSIAVRPATPRPSQPEGE